MIAFWQSRIGWIFLILYLVLAGVLFHEALTCSGWVCDLAAIPAIIPLGFPIGWLIDAIDTMFAIPGHVPTFHMRNWYFIIPTVAANGMLYYWIGWLLDSWLNKRRSRKT